LTAKVLEAHSIKKHTGRTSWSFLSTDFIFHCASV